MAITHVFDALPHGVADDWTMSQDWGRFTAEQHGIWDRLVTRQIAVLSQYASRRYLVGLGLLDLERPGIPDYDALNPLLRRATGWQVVAVPGVVPNEAFFRLLSTRRFPAANFLRDASSLDYSEEPDLFHDLVGHLPMLADPVFADFMERYGRAGLRAETLGTSDYLARFYLHTVEFGLVLEEGELRAFGAGLLSSYAETVHALADPAVRRLRFDLQRVMRTGYLFDEFQRSYFVINSFEDLLRIFDEADMTSVYGVVTRQPLLAPGEPCDGDQPFALPERERRQAIM